MQIVILILGQIWNDFFHLGQNLAILLFTGVDDSDERRERGEDQAR